EEGVLDSAQDGDLGAVFGLGFPPFRGGPFRYVDQEGAETVARKLAVLAERYGPRFEPAGLLRRHAETHAMFYAQPAPAEA
ncbi:MAG: crotonase, partial [Rhodothermales bacterium]|nr:crotonase [Rhodothermales bacterium]